MHRVGPAPAKNRQRSYSTAPPALPNTPSCGWIAAALTAGQFDALVSFAFNVGAGGLQRSMLHRKVNREEHALVPAELLKWVWAGGRKLKGLVRRREAEARLYAA
jgi:GH24 family phage-related lysozyme (muramidase)